MEELLRYTVYQIMLGIIEFELLVMLILAVIIVLFKSWMRSREKKNQQITSRLSALAGEAVKDADHQTAELSKELQSFPHLIKTIETFDNRFNDQAWKDTRQLWIDRYIRPNAASYVRNRHWMKRQLGARALLLDPPTAQNSDLRALLCDREYLVRVVAAMCMVKKGERELLFEVVVQMSKEPNLSRFAYRDALINADSKTFNWLEELLRQTKNPEISAICLDLFATRTTKNLFPLLLPFIYGEDKKCKLLSVKVLQSLSSEEVADILFHCLHDSDWQVRAEAVRVLSPSLARRYIIKLEQLLNDSEWFTRLQAALKLRSIGEEGINVLSRQIQTKASHASEIAEYALAQPSLGNTHLS